MSNKLKFLDHSGDSGLQVWGDSIENVFTISAKGMFSIITESKDIKPEKEYSVSLQADSNSDLLVYWLNHLNFLFSTNGFLLSQIKRISVQKFTLKAFINGAVFSSEKHEILREIKAVTYHQLILEKQNNSWFAQVIFDL